MLQSPPSSCARFGTFFLVMMLTLIREDLMDGFTPQEEEEKEAKRGRWMRCRRRMGWMRCRRRRRRRWRWRRRRMGWMTPA